MSVYLLATLDTKGPEAAWVQAELAARGISTVLVDTGCLGQPSLAAQIPREQVFQAAGSSLVEMQSRADRGQAIAAAARGAAAIVIGEYQSGKLQGVFALGGSAGTTIGTAAMRTLPIGVPKLMVSTLASGQVRHYVGDKDILMLNCVVDLCGVNRINRPILTNAAAAMAGMLQPEPVELAAARRPAHDKPLIAASMFGVTTPCVERARALLEQAGYEVLVFHATGNGGQAMESLIAEGLIAGVLDITTTELADELVGGILTAGPDRLTAASRMGVPQVVSVGALDMVNFGPLQPDGLPQGAVEKLRHRKFYQHNANVTLMRTTPNENAQLGEEICRKLQSAMGPVAIVAPLKGVSAIDRLGQPFDDPAAREALFGALRRHHGPVELIELDCHINDPAFADLAARKLLSMLESRKTAQDC